MVQGELEGLTDLGQSIDAPGVVELANEPDIDPPQLDIEAGQQAPTEERLDGIMVIVVYFELTIFFPVK